jgi:predicted phage terminase large subunit-like protein
MEIRPQPGPQTQFLSTRAEIAFYGGAAGGGKSFALLIDPVRHHKNAKFGGVIFRRNTTMVRNEGGLWDESVNIYQPMGAHPRPGFLEWEFQDGMRMKFAHLEHEKTVLDWQGSQIPWIGFDELTHFTRKQFWYMLSRNRSTSGVRGRIRGTTNPDVDSWVREMIDWWIDEEGYPIKERSGKLRYFIRQEDELVWADHASQLLDKYGQTQIPKSFTFIPSNIQDNKILMEKDPGYLSNLMALPRVERLRLLGGNWNVRPAAGDYFQEHWFEVLDAISQVQKVRTVRYWDRAATRPSETNADPDWTRGILLSQLSTGIWVVEDIVSIRDTPLKVEQCILNTATSDGWDIQICVEQDPGSSGVADADNYVKLLCGYNVQVRRPTKDKVTRALPVSAQAQAGNIKVMRASWNKEFFRELENFPLGCHDDQVDVLSGAFNEMSQSPSILDVL